VDRQARAGRPQRGCRHHQKDADRAADTLDRQEQPGRASAIQRALTPKRGSVSSDSKGMAGPTPARSFRASASDHFRLRRISERGIPSHRPGAQRGPRWLPRPCHPCLAAILHPVRPLADPLHSPLSVEKLLELFRAPWCSPDMPVDDPSPSETPPSTILVIEPDILVRMTIADYLRSCGYRVFEGATADDVVTVLGTQQKIDGRLHRGPTQRQHGWVWSGPMGSREASRPSM